MMSDKTDRPPLRVVAPHESAPKAEAPASPLPMPPSQVSVAFGDTVRQFDAVNPIGAAYLACVGAHLADQALAFYHSAASHAPAGTFRHDVPPGLKSAEATRAWLGTHLAAIKHMAHGDDTVGDYARAADLKEATLLSAGELDRALGAVRTAGLQFDARRDALLSEAIDSMNKVPAIASEVVGALAKKAAPVDDDIDLWIALACDYV